MILGYLAFQVELDSSAGNFLMSAGGICETCDLSEHV